MSYIIYENCSILEQKQKSASLSGLPLTIEKNDIKMICRQKYIRNVDLRLNVLLMSMLIPCFTCFSCGVWAVI